MYFMMTFLETSLSNASTNENQNLYVICDDTKLSERVTLVKYPNDTDTIYVSEFGENVMKYLNSIYKRNETYTDKKYLNTYEIKQEKKNETDESCDLILTLKANTSADFSKIAELAKEGEETVEKMFENTSYSNITEESADYVLKLKKI